MGTRHDIRMHLIKYSVPLLSQRLPPIVVYLVVIERFLRIFICHRLELRLLGPPCSLGFNRGMAYVRGQDRFRTADRPPSPS